MDTSVLAQIAALRRMSVPELQGEWLRLHGEPARGRNRSFLFKRLAWELQARVRGGLSPRTKQRLAELIPGGLDRATRPKQTATVPDAAPVRKLRSTARPTTAQQSRATGNRNDPPPQRAA